MSIDFKNPDHLTENYPVSNLLAERAITHIEIMELAAQKIRLKIKKLLDDDNVSPTIIAQYSMLAGVVEHSTKAQNLSFTDCAVGSGTIAKISEGICAELGLPYGVTSTDSQLSLNGGLPMYQRIDSPLQGHSIQGSSDQVVESYPSVVPIDV